MDTFVSGSKGSGKTYYAVDEISKLPDPSKVLHNIKGLSLGKNMGDLAKEWGLSSHLDFFRNSLHADHLDDGVTPNPAKNPNFDSLRGNIFVVDECQNLFPKTFKNPDVDAFFSMARHYDIDIILLTQNDLLVCPTIKVHPELQLRAVSSTANPFPFFFHYRKMVGGINGEQIGTIRKLRRKKIFDLYNSSDTKNSGKDAHKRSRPMLFVLFIALIATVGGIFYLKQWVSSKREAKQEQSVASVADPLSEKRSNYRSGKTDSYNQQKDGYSQNTYPQSIIDKLGGIPIPISEVNDYTGRYVELLGTLYHVSEFPFPIFKSRLGLSALVPQDVFQAVQDYKQQLAIMASVDPNAGYETYNEPDRQYSKDESSTQ